MELDKFDQIKMYNHCVKRNHSKSPNLGKHYLQHIQSKEQ